MNSPAESTDRPGDTGSRALAALNRVTTNSPYLPFASLLASLIIIFVARCSIVAEHIDMGCDIANYLSTTNTLFGHDVLGMGLLRPPLIGVVLRPFTLVLGDLTGVKTLGVLISVATGIPFYLLARRVCRPWIAVGVTLVFVLMPAYSDMLTWGYLTMFGMFFIMLTIHFLLRVLEQPSKLSIFSAGLCASFVVGFHQLSLAFFAPLCLLLFMALLAFDRPRILNTWKPLAAAVAVALVLSLPYAPVYLRLLRLQAQAASETPLISFAPIAQVRAGFEFNIDPSWVPWLLGILFIVPLAAVTLRDTWRKDRTALIVLLVTFLYSLALIVFVFPPPFLEINRRAHHFMYIPLWVLVGLSLSHLWSWQTILHRNVPHWLPKLLTAALALALLSSTVLPSFQTLTGGLDYFGYLDSDRWEAVRWLRDNTPEESSIATYPETLGWWIEAEAERRTANVADRDTVPLDYYRERSLAADRILSRNQGLENGNLRLATTYPYRDGPGNPVLGVYLGGFYRDIVMFDEDSTFVTTQTDNRVAITSAPLDSLSIGGDEDSGTMTASYHIGDAVVAQTARLDRRSQAAVISYHIRSVTSTVTRIDIPILPALDPDSVDIAPGGRSVQVLQTFSDQPKPVLTQIDIDTAGCSLDTTSYHPRKLDLSFSLQGNEATVTFSLLVMDPVAERDQDVTFYETARVIGAYSINYVAIDLNPNPNLSSQLPSALDEWLRLCPYYQLVYPLDGPSDIRLYRVCTQALPS